MIREEMMDGGFVRHYSDAGLYIRQIETGCVYDDAIDVVPCRFSYDETDEKIPVEEPETNEEVPVI